MSMLRAVLVSEGVVSGRAYTYKLPVLKFEYRTITRDQLDSEIERVKSAVASSIQELQKLKEITLESKGEEFAHIFRSHQTIAEDESIFNEIYEYITENLVSAEVGLSTIFDTYKDMFLKLEDGANKERVADLNDVSNRILRNLLGIPEVSLQTLPEESIVVAVEIFPSDTAMIDDKHLKGFITEKGGTASHVAIIARAMGIPAVCGVERAVEVIQDREEVLLEAMQPGKARVYVSPNEDERAIFLEAHANYTKYKTLLEHSKGKKAVTLDGHNIMLSANIGSEEDIHEAFELGAESVGLFRTEFLFMKQRTLANEEQQYQAYRKAAEKFSPNMVVIRTLDVGGDKQISAFTIPSEDNPFLGYRAIRIGLDNPNILIPQIRAILRASAHGNVKMMFPMIDSLREIRSLKRIIEDIKHDLKKDNTPFDENIEMGIMIEIPSVLFIIDAIVREVDFVSIGTNDLTQYLLAVDRTNAKVSEYYQPFHPSVLKAIHMVCEASHKSNVWVGICGELAGMKEIIPVLVGMGVDELSMSARKLPEAVFILRATQKKLAEKLAQEVLTYALVEEVDMCVAKAHHKIYTQAENNMLNTSK